MYLTAKLFQHGSELTQMGANVFFGSSSLASLCIPANVRTISQGCFRHCTSLVEVSFEHGSKLNRIEDETFVGCSSLRSLALPAQLEIVACGAFSDCKSLCELIFDLPSRLKQLDLPPSEFGSLCIPDCVEIIFGGIGKQDGQRRLLQFGRASNLIKVELRHLLDVMNRDRDAESDSFLRLSEEVLRRFRSVFEAL
jgi:hypothetical protein